MQNSKQISAQIIKSDIKSDDYDAAFIMSSVNKDRDDDTFSAKALEAVAKSTKPLIALWQHKQDQPIGVWSNLSFDGNKLKGYIKISSTNLGKMIKQLLADGVPLASSVGFRVLEGEPNKYGGYEFKKVDMFECSVVSTPANPQALQVAKSYGFGQEIFSEASKSSVENVSSASVAKSEILKNAKLAVLAANKLNRRILS